MPSIDYLYQRLQAGNSPVSIVEISNQTKSSLRQAKTELEAVNRRMKQELEMAAGI